MFMGFILKNSVLSVWVDYPLWIMGQTDYNLPVGLFCFKIQLNFFFFLIWCLSVAQAGLKLPSLRNPCASAFLVTKITGSHTEPRTDTSLWIHAQQLTTVSVPTEVLSLYKFRSSVFAKVTLLNSVSLAPGHMILTSVDSMTFKMSILSCLNVSLVPRIF